MIVVSEAYKQATESNQRESYVLAKYGLYNKEAKRLIDLNEIVYSAQKFSDIKKTFNEVKETDMNYISGEPNRVKLDGSFYFIRNKEQKNASENIAYWSNSMSNENGYFTSYNPIIEYYFTQKILFTELTLYFQEVCEEFNIKYYNDGNKIAERQIINNNSLVVTTNGIIPYAETYFDNIDIEFIKTKEPYRYIKFNEIDFGVYQTFTKKDILNYDLINELSLDSSELTSNSLNLKIQNFDGKYDLLNPNSQIQYLQEKQELTLYHYLKVGERYNEVPLGTFLLKDFDVSNGVLNINAYDDIYFMNKMYYGSKFYNGTSAYDIFRDVFLYFNITKYEIDEELKSVLLTGYIPNVECREALRRIAEASMSVIKKDRYGITKIFRIKEDSRTSKNYTRKLINKERIEKNLFNTSIDMNYYNYNVDEIENKTIYNGKVKNGRNIILFKELPILPISLEKVETNNDYEIVDIYATSCVVNVKTEETNVKLKADVIPRESVTERISKNQNADIEEYAIDSVDNTLITKNNVYDVANWKLNKSPYVFKIDSLLAPNLEVGDKCVYETRYGQKMPFILTRINFSNSIINRVEGE